MMRITSVSASIYLLWIDYPCISFKLRPQDYVLNPNPPSSESQNLLSGDKGIDITEFGIEHVCAALLNPLERMPTY
jgi:hypothetical protein